MSSALTEDVIDCSSKLLNIHMFAVKHIPWFGSLNSEHGAPLSQWKNNVLSQLDNSWINTTRMIPLWKETTSPTGHQEFPPSGCIWSCWACVPFHPSMNPLFFPLTWHMKWHQIVIELEINSPCSDTASIHYALFIAEIPMCHVSGLSRPKKVVGWQVASRIIPLR